LENKLNGGLNYYGFPIGIIMMDTKFPRPIGDIGHAGSFPFPVLYKTVRGASASRIVMERDRSMLEPFIEAGRELCEKGVKAIATSCGFLAIFHRELSKALDVPVFTSSLIQIPLVYAATGGRPVGVLTANRDALTDTHFESVGAKDIPIEIEGVENDYLWTVFRDDLKELDLVQAEKDIIAASKRLVAKNSKIGGIVLECTNLPQYAHKVQEAVNLPVFDIVTLIHMAYQTVDRKAFY